MITTPPVKSAPASHPHAEHYWLQTGAPSQESLRQTQFHRPASWFGFGVWANMNSTLTFLSVRLLRPPATPNAADNPGSPGIPRLQDLDPRAGAPAMTRLLVKQLYQ